MKEITVGMTGLEVRNILNNVRKEYNVKDYGVKGDGITDDTVAIQTVINDVYSAGGGTIYFPTGVYIIGGALQTNVGGINYKSQLYIPYKTYTALDRTSVTLSGDECVNFTQSGGLATNPVPDVGTRIRSTLISSTSESYIIGSKGAAGPWGSINYNQCNIRNINFQVTCNGSSQVTLGGIGFEHAANTIVENTTVFPYGTNIFDTAAPINDCTGISLGMSSSDNIHHVINVVVAGFDTGIKVGEHATLIDACAWVCRYGVKFVANDHAIMATRLMAHWCIYSITFTGIARVLISEFIDEWMDHGYWYDNINTIYDPSDYGRGEIHYNIVEHDIGFNNTKFSKSGGANLQCSPIAFATVAEFTVTGARDEPEGALKDLIAKLVAQGIIVDGTTAS